ncbi:hypothetical protein [Nostoc sp.]
MFKRKVSRESPTQDACQCQLKDVILILEITDDLHHSIQQVLLPM